MKYLVESSDKSISCRTIIEQTKKKNILPPLTMEIFVSLCDEIAADKGMTVCFESDFSLFEMENSAESGKAFKAKFKKAGKS